MIPKWGQPEVLFLSSVPQSYTSRCLRLWKSKWDEWEDASTLLWYMFSDKYISTSLPLLISIQMYSVSGRIYAEVSEAFHGRRLLLPPYVFTLPALLPLQEWISYSLGHPSKYFLPGTIFIHIYIFFQIAPEVWISCTVVYFGALCRSSRRKRCLVTNEDKDEPEKTTNNSGVRVVLTADPRLVNEGHSLPTAASL